MDPIELHRVVRELLKTACTEGRLEWGVLAEWEKQWENCRDKLPLLEQKAREMEAALKKSLEPPLHYAVYLGPAPGDQRDVVVGANSARLEVHLTDGAAADVLVPGQELVLNNEQNVVATRSMYSGGETAEVINILKPEQAAEVLEITRGTAAEPLALRVRWREGEEIEVLCGPDLQAIPLRRGDVVAIDPDAGQAVARVRPRLHVRAGGHEGIVVEIGDVLFEQGVQIGDIVRVEPGLRFAFEKLPSYETGGLALEDIPDVSYADIGGLDEQIEQVYDAIELPYLYRRQFEDYQLSRPKGLLLYGPPGCGKTMIAKAVANSLTHSIRDHLVALERRIVLYRRLQDSPNDAALLDECRTLLPAAPPETALTPETARDGLRAMLDQHRVNLDALDRELQTIRAVLASHDGVRSFFLNVKGPELLDKYVGETEHRIRKIFEEARRYASFYTPVVIFFDEMESMFRARGSGRSSDVETTIVPQFLAELDGVEASENLIVIGASNRAELIDPAIMRPGRLDIKIRVERPTREAALDILALYLLPTLPLDERDVLPADAPLDGLSKIVFRTAYRAADGSVVPDLSGDLAALASLLPVGCDCRLARAVTPDLLQAWRTLPGSTPVREAASVLAAADHHRSDANVLRRLKGDLALGDVIAGLDAIAARCDQSPDFEQTLRAQARREWLAEALIVEAVQVLYSPSSLMNVLTGSGSRYTFYVKDFLSGAVLANIVARAKKRAVKRVVIGQEGAPQGISLDDLRTAIHAEFDESRDQLAQHKLSADLGLNEQPKVVELILQTGQLDPWNEDKLRPYEAFG